ncbi:type 2 lanthipeptide synthetase LanM family protein [Microlunatus sp. Gsoil 973]|uniref:type 2 lanthipeptide synthetase LanM family protein n=1 Tax=Microlunatus sp. Gsoil 973 TaxID=2672569 RepID=UPI0012B471F0|nr:type 2 lanthipeptide synthetase LanM family protein [Microlunatus sp. Gsoil 973]QGN32509.1 type 2 lantipeptide synthetase LanM [Microlunatus sp. Gsoil 973]
MTQPGADVFGRDDLRTVGGLPAYEAALQVAVRASNLAEQTAVVAALADVVVDESDQPLRPAEDWQIGRLADRLADQRTDVDTITRVVRRYRTWRRRADSMDQTARATVADIHRRWIGVYAEALADFAPAPDSVEAPTSSRHRIGLACAPFTQHLRRRLAERRAVANRAAGRELISREVVDAFEAHLLDRFELAAAWAIEAHENLTFARWGASRETARDADHDEYFRLTFADAAHCHEFFLRFSVLARWLAAVTGQLVENGTQLINRLAADVDLIGEAIIGQPVRCFTSVELGKGDYHRGGNSVAMIGVDLGSTRAALVYKPRPLAVEVAMQRLLGRLSDDGVINFARRRVVALQDYGYEERIPHGRNEVESPDEAARIFEELGGFLAVFYVLGGSDLHHENVIVADGHAHICDCETVLGVEPPGHELGWHTVADSVFRTGLLEWPLPPTTEVVTRLSGYSGGGVYEVPFPVPRLQDGAVPTVRHETGVRIEGNAANRVRLAGTLLEAKDFEDSIVRGFTAVHDWFRTQPGAPAYIAEFFAATDIRYVARNTQTYVQLLIAARHPRCLVEPLEVDVVFRRLAEAPLRWDSDGRATAAELRSLWQLDVPTFGVAAQQHELLNDNVYPTGVTAARSPLQAALERIRSLPADDRLRQVSYISASLSTAKVRDDSFVITALEWAQLVGQELSGLLAEPGPGPRWSYAAADADVSDIEGTLYYGSAGVALFLGYLDAIIPSPSVNRAARDALAHSLSHPPRGIGGFDGLAGQAYVLAHLSALWGDQKLWDLAVNRVAQIDPLIDDDRDLDVLSGSAGVIAVLLAMSDMSDMTDIGLATAHRCAQHLLDHGVSGEHGLSWPSSTPEVGIADLTGFAHGAAGIGWALTRLGAATGHAGYIDAGLAAFEYERHHFDDEHQDWYDLRTSMQDPVHGRRHFGNAWCNGAPGIGLSRLESWSALGRGEVLLLDEAYTALAATLRGLSSVGNETLCHGVSGNSEMLLRIAARQQEPAFQLEANVQAQAMWRRLAAASNWPREEAGRQPLSGLMVGIAGVGMHFLRVAEPDRVPSPLLLDPPNPTLWKVGT